MGFRSLGSGLTEYGNGLVLASEMNSGEGSILNILKMVVTLDHPMHVFRHIEPNRRQRSSLLYTATLAILKRWIDNSSARTQNCTDTIHYHSTLSTSSARALGPFRTVIGDLHHLGSEIYKLLKVTFHRIKPATRASAASELKKC